MAVRISVLAAEDITAFALKLTSQSHLLAALPTSIPLFLHFLFGLVTLFFIIINFDALFFGFFIGIGLILLIFVGRCGWFIVYFFGKQLLITL